MSGFKDFIMKGNLIELATAFIMGTAFAAVVTAFADVIMDIIGRLLPIDLEGSFTQTAIGGVNIGAFLAALVSFLLISFVLYFAIVKPYQAYQKLRGGEEEAGEPTETELLTEIRDLLAKRESS